MPGSVKQIAHLDLDCFYVSVERIRDPGLNGKPVVVGGSPEGRGVVASASYEARAFGVRSAMPASQARRLCPQLIFVRSSFGEYGRISDELYRRMLEIAPAVERASIDEMYLDFTGCESLYGSDLPGFMPALQRLVHDEFKLPSSVGLATSKTLAKIAVGTVKPAGVCVVRPGEERSFLAPLPVGVIPGVGAKTEATLHLHGLRRVEDLQRRDRQQLIGLLGKHGDWLHRVAMGEGSDTLETGHTRKSISQERTFDRDLTDTRELEAVLLDHVEAVCSTLRGRRWKARTIGLKLRYGDFTTLTRARTVDATDDDPVVFRVVRDLFRRTYETGQGVRLLGVHLSNFDEQDQLELELDPRTSRRTQLLQAVEEIRTKYGDGAIHIGRE
jgi:DNA polymerase-4